jgi:hypothetical protein
MRNLTSILTLSLLLAHVSPSCGDWFYDFDDGIIPDTFVTEGFSDWSGTPSDTLQASADDGVLRMWDSTPSSSGGTTLALGYNDEVFGGGVRVSAEINSSENTIDGLGLAARVSDSDNESFYVASVIFDTSRWNYGWFYVSKALPNGQDANVVSSWRIPDSRQSYFVELEVIDDAITGFPNVTGRLFDHEGGTLLTEISMTDTGLGGFPPVTSGTAQVASWTPDGDFKLVDGTFDNIRAEALTPYLLGDMNLDGAVNGLDVDPFVEAVVGGAARPASPFVAAVLGVSAAPIPEPSTLLLTLVALAVVGGWRKWKRAA